MTSSFGFRTWLWTILLNQCRRYAGRQASHARSDLDRGPSPWIRIIHNGPRATGGPDGVLTGLMAHERREVLENFCCD